MWWASIFTATVLLAVTNGQQVCNLTVETHPALTWSQCSAGGACTPVEGYVTADANWRWTHAVADKTSCYNGNTWNSTICDSDASCATACCVEGADYVGTYGVISAVDELTLNFVTHGPYSTDVGSRVYLLDPSQTSYQTFDLLGQEFSFDVDVSNLPCGINGALYFVSMEADGGMANYPTNQAGAAYGTGYCDAQCPRDLKFVNGMANVQGWSASTNDNNTGLGGYGSCCAEMDLWEANSMASAFTAHPCSNATQHICTGSACLGGANGTTDCDRSGCDFNSYRVGNTDFYGPGMTVNTSAKFTVVTQFPVDTSGSLTAINRFYIQNGKLIANADSKISGVTGSSLSTDFCAAEMTAFNETNNFQKKGGMVSMTNALKGMVLVMSLWDDHGSQMLWLDSTYPVNGTAPGDKRGSCATTSGVASELEANAPNSSVVFSNVKFGPISSTFGGSNSDTSGANSASSTILPPLVFAVFAGVCSFCLMWINM